MENQEKLYTLREAAAFLGINYFTFRFKVGVSKEIVPDGMINPRKYFFRQSTLDRLKAEQEELLNVEEAAAYLGVTVATIDYYQYKLPEDKRLKPDNPNAGVGRTHRFKRATLDRFRPGAPPAAPGEPGRRRRGPKRKQEQLVTA
jgi:hypothetical protein